MIYIDDRIVKENDGIFSNMIGKKLVSISHDPYIDSNSIIGIVAVKTEDTTYKVSNLIEVKDYFGQNEDVAVFRVNEDAVDNIHSYIQFETLITTPIEKQIISVDVVNEHQCLYENGFQTYDVWVTRGFVLILEDGLQISFEKEIWFSEEINIEKGYNLANKFFGIDRITDGWSEPKKMICEREIIHF